VATVIPITSAAGRWEVMTAVASLASSKGQAIEIEMLEHCGTPCGESDSILSLLESRRELSDPETCIGYSLFDGGEIFRLRALGRSVHELCCARRGISEPGLDLCNAANSAVAAAKLALVSLVMGPVFENYETPATDLIAAPLCVEFPWGRWDVMDCVARLGDPEHQVAVWIHNEIRDKGEFDTFEEAVNILFCDRYVLPHPEAAVRSVLALGPEIEHLAMLGTRLDEVLDRLGDVPFEHYFGDPIWPTVVAAAQDALAAMVLAGRFRECSGDGDSDRP